MSGADGGRDGGADAGAGHSTGPVRPTLRLEAAWHADAPGGRLVLELVNCGASALTDFTLSFTSMVRATPSARCENARTVAQDAYCHELAPPEGLVLAPGGVWRLSIEGMRHPARHRTDGPRSAFVTLPGERRRFVATGEVHRVPAQAAAIDTDAWPYPALLPWPAAGALTGSAPPPAALVPAPGTDADGLSAVAAVAGLFARLFPADPVPFRLADIGGAMPVALAADPALGAEAFRLHLADGAARIAHGGAAGRLYGLIALGQMWQGARGDGIRPGSFAFPASGEIADAPHHPWRGCHLDTARQFFTAADLHRFLDILAWHRINVFHWHLTDDEAWRLEIPGLPQLVETGASCGPGQALPPHVGVGPGGASGHYRAHEVRGLVAHAADLGITILPEIDLPGHCCALLSALPDLIDPEETAGAYLSVQGYWNNALNPGNPAVWPVLERILDTVCDLFPGEFVHLGGDEVAPGAWMGSPMCRALMAREGLADTGAVQGWFMGRLQAMLAARGRRIAVWDELADSGGIDPSGALMFAWQTRERAARLLEAGFATVLTPAQDCYLNLAASPDWDAPGVGWAGHAPLSATYGIDDTAGAPAGGPPSANIRGVQACIWTENFTSRAYFNRLVFPRLSALAEVAWTPPARRDLARFERVAATAPAF